MTAPLPLGFRDEGILPHSEIVRLAAKYPKARPRGDTKDGAILPPTLRDIQRLMGLTQDKAPFVRRQKFWGWLAGDPSGFTRYRRKQLSRILMLLEEGRFERRTEGIFILEKPTKKPETVMRLVLSEKKIAGRTVLTHTIVRGEQLPGSRVMPPFKSFALGSRG